MLGVSGATYTHAGVLLHTCVQHIHLHTHCVLFFNCLFCNDMVFINAGKKPNGLHVQKCEKILIWLHKYSKMVLVSLFQGRTKYSKGREWILNF